VVGTCVRAYVGTCVRVFACVRACVRACASFSTIMHYEQKRNTNRGFERYVFIENKLSDRMLVLVTVHM